MASSCPELPRLCSCCPCVGHPQACIQQQGLEGCYLTSIEVRCVRVQRLQGLKARRSKC
eukprot:XP_001699688.1 predicted protein [Chlamydomonas reinhardtii]